MKWLLALTLFAGGCSKPRPNQCPSNLTGVCLNGEVCTFDRGRGCQSCMCRELDKSNTGHDPDDSNPPVPVHD
jgi:hypothetical protein